MRSSAISFCISTGRRHHSAKLPEKIIWPITSQITWPTYLAFAARLRMAAIRPRKMRLTSEADLAGDSTTRGSSILWLRMAMKFLLGSGSCADMLVLSRGASDPAIVASRCKFGSWSFIPYDDRCGRWVHGKWRQVCGMYVWLQKPTLVLTARSACSSTCRQPIHLKFPPGL